MTRDKSSLMRGARSLSAVVSFSLIMVTLGVTLPPRPTQADAPPPPPSSPPSSPPSGTSAPAAPLARIHAVGRWPEGVVASGGALWVAESGARRVSRYSLEGERLEQYKVGRLPVDLLARPNGEVWVSVVTDQVVKRLSARRKLARKVARTQEYAEAIGADAEHLYALVWPSGSSATSRLMRHHLATGAAHLSADVGPNAMSLTLTEGVAWVGLEGALVAVHTRTLAPTLRLTVSPTERVLESAAYGERVYVGVLDMSRRASALALLSAEGARGEGAVAGEGRAGEGGAIQERALGSVALATLPLTEPISAIAAWDDLVAVSLRSGALLTLHPLTLRVSQRWTAEALGVKEGARGIARAGGRLWLTTHAGEGGLLVEVPLEERAPVSEPVGALGEGVEAAPPPPPR